MHRLFCNFQVMDIMTMNFWYPIVYMVTVEKVTNAHDHARLCDFLRDNSVLSKITQPFTIIAH